jgi:hypothetical protein
MRGGRSALRRVTPVRKAGNCFGLLLETGNRAQQTHQIKNHFHAIVQSKKFQISARVVKGHEGPNDRADARAVDLRYTGEVHQHFTRAVVKRFAQILVQHVGVAPNDGLPLHVEDRDIAGFSNFNLQTHVDPLPQSRSGEFPRTIRASMALIISLLRADKLTVRWESKYGASDPAGTMVFHRDGNAICLSRFAARRFVGAERNSGTAIDAASVSQPAGAIA